MKASFRIIKPLILGIVLGASLISSAYAAKADEYVAEAKQYFSKGEVKSGIIQLKNALQSDPTHVEARLLLGTVYLQQGKGPEAEKEYSRARQVGAPASRWVLGYSRALLMQGKQREFVNEFSEIPEGLEPSQKATLLALKGRAYLVEKDETLAKDAFEASVKADPKSPLGLLGKAELEVRAGNLESALDQMNVLVESYPENSEARAARAEVLGKLGRHADAVVDLSKLIELKPNQPQYLVKRALTNVALNEPQSALDDIKKLRKLNPNYPAADYAEGLALFIQQDYEKARDLFQAVLGRIPEHPQSQLLYGVASYGTGDYEVAREYLDRSFTRLPKNLQLGKMLAAALLKLQDTDKAIVVLENLVDDFPEDPQLVTLLGTAYMQSGDNVRGSELLEKAVELAPDTALLRTQLAIGQLVSGKTDDAIQELKSAVDLGQEVIQADVLLVLSYLRKEEYEQAFAASKELEKRLPDNPIPPNLTGLAHMAAKNYAKAEEKFLRALELDPKFVVAEINQARLALLQNDPDGAREHFNKALEIDKNNLSAMLGFAKMAEKEGDEEKRTQWLEKALKANPNALQPRLVLIENYLQTKEPLKAKTLLAEVSERQAETPTVLRLTGMAQLQAGEYSNAARTFDRLTLKAPKLIEGWFQLGRAYAATGDFEASRTAFKRAIELDEQHQVPLIYAGLGEVVLKLGDYKEVLVVAQDMQQYFPNNPTGFELEAASWRKQGHIANTIKALEKAVRIDPTTKRITLMANLFGAAGQLPKGVTLLEDWLQDNPKDAVAKTTLAMFYQQGGKLDQAAKKYEEILQLNDQNPVVLNNLAWLHFNNNNPKAEELAKKAYDIAPERAEIADTYGWIIASKGKVKEGLSILQQALVLAPNNPDIILHTGRTLHLDGRTDEAKELLKKLTTQHAGTSQAKQAERLLQQM